MILSCVGGVIISPNGGAGCFETITSEEPDVNFTHYMHVVKPFKARIQAIGSPNPESLSLLDIAANASADSVTACLVVQPLVSNPCMSKSNLMLKKEDLKTAI